MWKIVARKPRDLKNEWVLVDKGLGNWHRWVVATVNEHSLKFNEWMSGSYFKEKNEALACFNERKTDACW